ncbi:hypothetical protein [Kocuria marina]
MQTTSTAGQHMQAKRAARLRAELAAIEAAAQAREQTKAAALRKA